MGPQWGLQDGACVRSGTPRPREPPLAGERPPDLTLALLCPQGPNGPQGPTGFPGPKGPPVSNTEFSRAPHGLQMVVDQREGTPPGGGLLAERLWLCPPDPPALGELRGGSGLSWPGSVSGSWGHVTKYHSPGCLHTARSSPPSGPNAIWGCTGSLLGGSGGPTPRPALGPGAAGSWAYRPPLHLALTPMGLSCRRVVRSLFLPGHQPPARPAPTPAALVLTRGQSKAPPTSSRGPLPGPVAGTVGHCGRGWQGAVPCGKEDPSSWGGFA